MSQYEAVQDAESMIADVAKDIKRVAESIGIEPGELDLARYGRNGGLFDGRALRRFGGFAAIARDAFAKHGDTVAARALSRRNGTARREANAATDALVTEHQILEAFRKMWTVRSAVIPSKVSKPNLRPPKVVRARANGVLISDTHLGLKIAPDEVMFNGYDWSIGARRLGKLAEQVATYKMGHRNECDELHVCLGGDLGQGIIHMSDNNTDLITYQVNGISQYMVQMIDYWRHYYKVIHVHCTPDNHLRLTHKGPDRAMAQKFDSFSSFIHLAIQMAFRDCEDVLFTVPKTAITTFDVLGHKFGMTHGDTHINSGNVGHNVNVKSIANQLLRLNGAQSDGRPFDAFLMGHVHVPLYMHLNETNTRLIVNGTASGTDPYAETVGFFRTRPSQVIWESTADYAVGDFRIVDLGDADDNADFEEIIEPYDYKMKLMKALQTK
jgi:hypothetical protein